MLVSQGKSEIAKKRAELMVESQDGFYIAEQDLQLRGPGEIFGTRQHGVPDLAIADLAKHMKILYEVKKEADIIIGSSGKENIVNYVEEKTEEKFFKVNDIMQTRIFEDSFVLPSR